VTGSCDVAATHTFGVLPFASMI